MNIKEYKERLAKHDWYYSSSDDSKLYIKGLTEENILKKMNEGKKTYKAAYEKEFNKHFKKS